MEMFEPSLTLTREPDGQYTLCSVTITPNSCYSAKQAKPGAPPNVRLTAETFPILLPLRARTGPCKMVLTPVRHRRRNLNLGDQHGKTTVLAFVMLDGNVLGSASIPVGDATPVPGTDPPVVDTADWYAWVNRMPPGPASFHVTGTVFLPNPGYKAALAVATPQGINPADLILDLQIEKLPGIWPEVITPTSVRYDQTDYQGIYKTVLVREPDGDATQITVEEAF